MTLSIIDKFCKLLKIKGYSKSTIQNYAYMLRLFLSDHKNRDWKNLPDRDILNKLYLLIVKRKMAYSTQKQLLSAIKLFYREMYNREVLLNALRLTRKPGKIPVVLSKQEVQRLLQSTHNLKHKAMLSVVYGMGLRSGELLNLRLSDIDKHRDVVTIFNAKGKKDRIVMLSKKIRPLLREYYKKYQPKTYLFEGQKGGKYTRSSLRKMLRKALQHVNIQKPATHLLENGIDIRIIQKLLGHKSNKTTMIYTHVANTQIINIESPLDTL